MPINTSMMEMPEWLKAPESKQNMWLQGLHDSMARKQMAFEQNMGMLRMAAVDKQFELEKDKYELAAKQAQTTFELNKLRLQEEKQNVTDLPALSRTIAEFQKRNYDYWEPMGAEASIKAQTMKQGMMDHDVSIKTHNDFIERMNKVGPGQLFANVRASVTRNSSGQNWRNPNYTFTEDDWETLRDAEVKRDIYIKNQQSMGEAEADVYKWKETIGSLKTGEGGITEKPIPDKNGNIIGTMYINQNGTMRPVIFRDPSVPAAKQAEQTLDAYKSLLTFANNLKNDFMGDTNQVDNVLEAASLLFDEWKSIVKEINPKTGTNKPSAKSGDAQWILTKDGKLVPASKP